MSMTTLGTDGGAFGGALGGAAGIPYLLEIWKVRDLTGRAFQSRDHLDSSQSPLG